MNQYNSITLLLAIAIGISSYIGFQDRSFVSEYIFSIRAILGRKEHYRLISSGFLHADWWHLIFNMYGFLGFSSLLAYLFGYWFPSLVLFLGIFCGNILSLIIHRNDYEYRAYGASGGVMAVIYMSIMIKPDDSIRMLLIPIDIPAYIFAIGYLTYSAYASTQRLGNVGHDAHIGGAILGIVLAIVFAPAVVLASPVLLISMILITVAYFYVVVLRRY